MKPRRIFLVRHGESAANLDYSIHAHTPDHRIELTDRGRQQAIEAGKALREQIGAEAIQFYVSPYLRTRQTLEGLLDTLGANPHRIFEEPRLREQEFGHFQERSAVERAMEERERYGRFFYRLPGGESGADVYDRVSTFLETMFRDFQKDAFAPNVILIAHGLTIRLFLMRWFHWTVEYFESLDNIANAEWFCMQQSPTGRYELNRPLRIWSDDADSSPNG